MGDTLVMTMRLILTVLTLFAVAFCASGVNAQPQTAFVGAPSSIPVQDFFRLPDVSRPALSPDGNHLAFLARNGGRLGLAVIDID